MEHLNLHPQPQLRTRPRRPTMGYECTNCPPMPREKETKVALEEVDAVELEQEEWDYKRQVAKDLGREWDYIG